MTTAKQAGTPDRDPRWEALMAPFPPDWVEKLPKVLSREDRDRGRCQAGSRFSADGHHCGGWHARAVHLDYVGHAGITMRLNDVVGPENWSWEPYTETPEGLPGWRPDEFWIKLTILGVTKIGVGDDSRSPKVLIGDALRNAAMRFGIGTYLWSKSEIAARMHDGEAETAAAPPARQQPRPQQAQAAAPTDVTAKAQALADLAQGVRDIGALKGVHDQAVASHLIGVNVTVDEVTGPLGQYLLQRKADFENEPERQAS